MKRILILLLCLLICPNVLFGANRLTTWSAGQTLTAANLNAEFSNVYIGDISRTAGYWGHNDDIPEYFGTSQDFRIEWETGQTNDAVFFGTSGSNTIIVGEIADIGTNWAIGNQTNPTLIIHSADATTALDYLSLSHNQTNSVINTANGSILLTVAGSTIGTVSSSGIAVTGALQTDSVTNDTGLAHGTFSPTDSANSNLDACTPSSIQYLRVGNTVTFAGTVTADATATGATSFEMDLPVASDLSATTRLAGAGVCVTGDEPISINAEATNNTAQFTWTAVSTASQICNYTLTYLVQ